MCLRHHWSILSQSVPFRISMIDTEQIYFLSSFSKISNLIRITKPNLNKNEESMNCFPFLWAISFMHLITIYSMFILNHSADHDCLVIFFCKNMILWWTRESVANIKVVSNYIGLFGFDCCCFVLFRLLNKMVRFWCFLKMFYARGVQTK